MGERAKRLRRKASRQWLDRHVNDPYVKRAQIDGYRSRAAYKLLEIDASERLIRGGQRVVDLGCAPGAWSQVLIARQRELGQPGTIIGLDLLPIEPMPGLAFLQGDFREQAVLDELEAIVGGAPLDLVVSDLSPNLSGVAVADAARMTDLAELALAFAIDHLGPDGALLVKCFHGSGFSQLVAGFRQGFRQVRERKPPASRAESAETYLVARGPRKAD
ncbi:MAG: RlmE family RNA methyltransferase [Burkholderiaceae bacterium]